ncbi:MAG TPA: hypothetical protein VF927_09350 [Solirubrobacteraceae bacterium]
MPILRLVKSPAGREVYEAVLREMQLHTQHPLGLIMHGASTVGGETQITQVWDSIEYLQRYEEEILGPALRAAGASLDAEVTVIELHDLVTP